MMDNRRDDSTLINYVPRLYEHLRHTGIRNANDCLNCSLFILYSVYKQIPFPNPNQSPDWKALKESGEVLYDELYHYVKNHLETPRYNDVMCDEYMRLRFSDIYSFKAHYQQALSFLFQYAFMRNSRQVAEFWHPVGLSYLIAQILSSYNIKSVYNPFAGSAHIMRSLRKDIHFLAQEINDKHVMYAKILQDAYQCENANIIQGDSFLDWRGKNYDAIYATMPWGQRENDFGEARGTSEAFFLRKASEDAVISIGVYPYSILFKGGNERTLRVDLIENDLVDCVIKLPARLFAPVTNVQTCIIITNRHKVHKGGIRFIDASSMVISRAAYTRLDVERLIQVVLQPDMENRESMWVLNQRILENSADLILERYLPVNLPEVPEGSRLISLGDILVHITRREPTDKSMIPLIRVSDLAVNPFDFTLDASSVKEAAYNSAFVYVNQPALFISRLRPLKPTYFVEKRGGAYVNPNIYAYQIIDTKSVSPQYLLNELTKDYVQKQLIYAGAVVPVLTSRTFLETKIMLPSREEQDLFVVKGLQAEQNVRDNTLSAALDVYLNEWGQRQHTLGHVVGALDDVLDALSYAREQNDGVLKDDDIIDTKGATVKNYFHKLSCVKSRLAELVDHLADGIAWEDPEEIPLVDFLKKYKKDNVQRNYSLEIVCAKENKFIVKFARKRLYDVIENIVHNCQKHGFVDDRDDYNIRIVVQETELNNKPAVSIVIMNNGRELDPSMDVEKVFTWAESTKGSGLGGSRIKLSVMTYGGTVEFLLQDGLPEGFNAGYKIVLPLFNNM